MKSLKQKHSQVWRMIFQNEEWLDAAERFGLNPVLIGYDLESYYESENSSTIISKTSDKLDEKYLALDPGDSSEDFTSYSSDMQKLFLFCLQQHEYDKEKKIIRLKNGLVIYVSSIFRSFEMLYLSSLTKLYNPSREKPESRYLFRRHVDNALGRVDNDKMGGIDGKGGWRYRFAFICCFELSGSSVKTRHRQQYFLQLKDFDGSDLRQIGPTATDEWVYHEHVCTDRPLCCRDFKRKRFY